MTARPLLPRLPQVPFVSFTLEPSLAGGALARGLNSKTRTQPTFLQDLPRERRILPQLASKPSKIWMCC